MYLALLAEAAESNDDADKLGVKDGVLESPLAVAANPLACGFPLFNALLASLPLFLFIIVIADLPAGGGSTGGGEGDAAP